MINISKLLKDAPKDMKLYSPLFGEVKFKYINDSQFGIVVEDSVECSRSFDKYGRYFTIYNNAECLLFPSKECRTWENFKLTKPQFKAHDWVVSNNQPAIIYELRQNYYLGKYLNGHDFCHKYADEDKLRLWTIKDAKDGDVLVSGIENPFIYNGNIEFSFAGAYVGVSRDGRIRSDMFPSKAWTSIKDVKPATKEQRDLLFQKIKETGYEWDSEKKELRKIKPHYDIANFYAGMPVLVRDSDNDEWTYTYFSHIIDSGDFNTGGWIWRQCIPFEGNKHLLGTTDMCDEQYINWQKL